MATTTGQGIIPNVVEHHRRIRYDNLTKLIDVELDLLMESFQEAKLRIDPIIAQINEARDKFDELVQQVGGKTMDLDVERELQDLKQETSKLKLKIPTNLIAPEYQPSADPNVILQPRTHPHKPTISRSNTRVVDDESLLWDGDKPKDLDYFSDRLNSNSYAPESILLQCFLAFPEGAFIKASLLCSYAYGVSKKLTSSKSVVSIACKLVSKGLIKSVYKKHSSTTVDGFWMDPKVHRTLKDRLSMEIQVRCLVNSSSIDGDDIIYRGSAEASTLPSNLRFLHLGKWQRYPTHHNIEMPDPNLYFKYASDIQDLMYISFRGVSVMKELPSFITRLWEQNGKKLRGFNILDLKACHHLEVLPSNIDNLCLSLTHLDMSECYFLDHMPASLSQLINLRILKGFFVAETNSNEKESCTLQDLSSMEYLVKLNIYTCLNTFPSENHLKILRGFRDLRNLTICWGGCPTRDESRDSKKSPATHRKRFVTSGPGHPVVRVDKKISFGLEKLDLRGAPENGTPNWLRPSNFEKLEKLYIRGGKLGDLRHIKEAQIDSQIEPEEEKWASVKILRLRHLSKLQLHWSELGSSFPNLVTVEKVECPNLNSFPCDEYGLWTKDTTQPPADGSERHGISTPVEREDTVVEIREQATE